MLPKQFMGEAIFNELLMMLIIELEKYNLKVHT